MSTGTNPPIADITDQDCGRAACVHLSPFLSVWVLGIIVVGPAACWAFAIRPFVVDQAREATNFHLTMLLAVVICGFTVVLWPFILFLIIFQLLLSIRAAFVAKAGICYRYPLTFRFF